MCFFAGFWDLQTTRNLRSRLILRDGISFVKIHVVVQQKLRERKKQTVTQWVSLFDPFRWPETKPRHTGNKARIGWFFFRGKILASNT